jgi:hypothetical protein
VSGKGLFLSRIFTNQGSFTLISSNISSLVLYSTFIFHQSKVSHQIFLISSIKSITSIEFLSYQSAKYKEIVILELMLSINLKLTSCNITNILIKNINKVKTNIDEKLRNLFLKIFLIEYLVIRVNIFIFSLNLKPLS